MRKFKLLSLLTVPLVALSIASCVTEPKPRDPLILSFIKVEPAKLEFESTAGSQEAAVKTTFAIVDVSTDAAWCDAELNDDNTVLTVTVEESDVDERTATITLTSTALDGGVVETTVEVTQSSYNDVRIPIVAAKADTDDVYSDANAISMAWDMKDGVGDPTTWWITAWNNEKTLPYDVVFEVNKASVMDYLVYTPKQHATASNINGCLGKVKIYWTSVDNPTEASDDAFTLYGEYDWARGRDLPGRVVSFIPALENVTGIKFSMQEVGGNNYIGIGDLQFYKNGAGKSVLGLSNSALSFEIGGGMQTVNVTTSNIEGDISVSAPDDWCTATISGDEITVNVAANTTSDATDRTSRITVSAGDQTKDIVVTQSAPQFSISKSSLLFETEGGEQTATITTNLTGIEVSRPSKDTWYEASYAGNTLTINVNPTSARAMHISEVTLTASNGSTKKVTVAQKGLNDFKLPVDYAWARTFNTGNEVEKSYDGDEGTWYMAGYQSTFPVDVVYYFRNVGELNHLIYHAKTNNANGRLGRVEIFYATKPYPSLDADFTSAGVYDWEKSADIRVIEFPQAIEKPTAIKLRILETGGGSNATTNYAGIKEIEFYQIGSEMTPFFELSENELAFEKAAGSESVTIDTNLEGTFTAAAGPGADWCTPTVDGTTVTVTVTEAAGTRSTTVTVTAPNNTTRTIAVTQTAPDIKLTVTGAKPDTDDIYASGNEVDKMWDSNENGTPKLDSWWITKNDVVHEYPYDIVFYVASDRMDYLIYSAKQHSSASNVNGCLGRVEIWWTSVADPTTAADSDFTKYGPELDWEHARTPVERRVEFSPALVNVTAIKLRLMEPGAPGSLNSNPETGWAGIGDVSFFKKAL